jgi:hypothetical protein
MTELLPKGTYAARATEAGLGKTSKGSEQVAVQFEIVDGEYAGRRLTWYGYFTDKTVDRTLESLEHCGWDGKSIQDLAGITRNEVAIVVDHEPDDKGNIRARIRCVNSQGGLAMKERLDLGAMVALEQRLKGKILAREQDRRNRGDAGQGDDDLNF